MKKRCKIIIKNFEIITDLKNSNTALNIWGSLPIRSTVQTWGEEIYFHTSVKAELESNAKDVLSLGEIAYWPSGRAIAIGFGKTPASIDNEIRLASKCNIWGNTKFDLRKLKNISNGEGILISKLS